MYIYIATIRVWLNISCIAGTSRTCQFQFFFAVHQFVTISCTVCVRCLSLFSMCHRYKMSNEVHSVGGVSPILKKLWGKEMRPPASPAMNLVDFCVRSLLETDACICAKPHASVDALKKSPIVNKRTREILLECNHSNICLSR